MIKNRCSPVSLVLFIAIGAFLICAVSAQAGGPSAAAGASSNGVTAAVRSVQPAVSGLFQVKAPRVWSNGVPAFLDTWDAFQSRTSSASLNKAYAFTTIDGLGHEVLYAGVERASSKSPVVFEFSRLEGERSVGDLRIEVEIDNAGRIGTVQFQSYSGDGAKAGLKLFPIAILAGDGCNDAGTACAVANGASLEVGANLNQLLNGDRFTAVKLTTPEDSVVGIFSLAPVTDGCVSEQSGFKAGCTANDVSLTALVPGSLNTKFCSNDPNRACSDTLPCAAPGLCNVNGNLCTGDPSSPGTVKFSATGRFLLTTQTRYDVGLFIDINGDPEDPFKTNPEVVPDAARSGQCTRFAFSNTEGVNAEGDGDADGCGDLTEAIAKPPAAPDGRAMPFGPVTIRCVDKDDDGLVDVYHCETWSQNEDEIDCQSSTNVKAGAPSKCNCGLLAGACIPFPNDDECLENVCALRCSGSSTTTCTIGGTECTGLGFCQDTLLLDQPKTNGTFCGDPASGVCDAQDTCVNGVCTDNKAGDGTSCGDDLRCNGDELCQAGECQPGTAVSCPPLSECHATSVCQETGDLCSHEHTPGAACGDSTSGACDDPDTCNADGTCNPNPKEDGTECAAAGGVCDKPDLCEAGVCVDQGFITGGIGPGGDEPCRAAGNECDAAEFCDGSGVDCPADFCGERVLRVNPYTCTAPPPPTP